MMNFANFTPRAQRAIELAKKEAYNFNHPHVGTEHLLLGLLALGEGVAVSILENMNVNLERVRMEIRKAVGEGPPTKVEGEIPFTPRAKKVLQLAMAEAQAMNHTYVGTEHILLGLLREGEGIAAQVLRNLDVDLESVREQVLRELNPDMIPEESTPQEPPSPFVRRKESEHKTPALDTFGRDLTELARKDLLDPLIGREEELERVIQILCRRTKNNPVLLGEAGVGKTAIVEGLARKIVEGDVPELMRGKRIVALDMALMIAGTKYRGQFEERIRALMEEIRRNKNIILFIDELHTIVGAGAAEGAMDASNIIKPALARGELQCVGATTLDEYRKHIEKDAALERRFQTVIIDEPTVEETICILKGIRKKYEEHHNVTYTDEALEYAARLAHRYITGRFLPDKAIDVMDEAGARVRIMSTTRPPELREKEALIAELKERKERAIKEQRFEEAANLRDMEKKEREALEKQLEAWRKSSKEQRLVVNVDDITAVVSKATGIPLKRMEGSELERLLAMEKELAKVVVGQDEAIEIVARSLRRARADLKDPRRPIGSFLFLGPTGVGKTLLAKALAEFMFGDPDALIQLDMSEYMEKFTVSRLMGSPPGYVGYEEGGQLTERVRRRPYAVVLFDEAEKAHPDVMHTLLQILDEGKLTDSLGRRVDFRNTIVILTSNLGYDAGKKGAQLGFSEQSEANEYEQLKKHMLDEARKLFKPELINRFDAIVVFRSLTRKHVEKILELELAKVSERLKSKGKKLLLSSSAKDFLIEKGYDKTLGARPLRRAIERFVEDPLSEEILRGSFEKADVIEVIAAGEKLKFRQRSSSDK